MSTRPQSLPSHLPNPYQDTRHHTVPRCLCKQSGLSGVLTGNLKKVPRYIHEAWHMLFGIDLPWVVSRKLRQREIRLDTRRKRRAYRIVFDTASFDKAADIVDREWIGLYNMEIETIDDVIKLSSESPVRANDIEVPMRFF